MSVFYDLNKTPRNILNQAIVRAIVSENNGALFDPSDLSTLFQDAAGTIPVTAVEQPVGKIIDKSGNGNNATQSVTASRPVLSARYNLLTKTEELSSSAWIKIFGGSGSAPVVTDNYGIAPDGSQTACRLQLNKGIGTTTTDSSQIYQSCEQLTNVYYSRSVYVKLTTGSEQKIIFIDSIGGLGNGQAITVTNNWTLVDLYIIADSTATRGFRLMCRGGYGTSDSADILVWHPQVRLSNYRGPYQRVTAANDYDTDERYFKKYLQFSPLVAIDDYLNLPYMSLYNGGAASIVCAMDVVSQATDTYIISERSTTDADPKYFPSRQLANAGNMDTYITDDAGAVVLDTVGSPFSGVANAVIRSIVDSGNNLKLFKNGVLAANDNYTRSGTLTLNNTTIGASVSTTTSNYASMKLYGLIVTKLALTDAQRIACERYLGRKSGVQL